jgi:hypothetical protein
VVGPSVIRGDGYGDWISQGISAPTCGAQMPVQV